MRVLKRIVATALVGLVAVAVTVRPVCAAACHRAAAAAGTAEPRPSAPPSHCAGMTHAAGTPTARILVADAHPCGEHARLLAADARLPRVGEAGVTMPAIAETSADIVPVAPPARHQDARRSGLPPPGPPRAPLVLRV